jgi:NADPH-dependent 2,4-dienoyl-CoA reductase/sulfur reductase-like enzyme
LAAATTAAEQGVEVALLDQQDAPGGQIYRGVEASPAKRAQQLGSAYRHGETLVHAFRQSGASYFADSQVWSLTRDRDIGLLHRGSARTIHAGQVVIATGAMERPVPFPGWTLPGVMNAGAGQILFKSHGIVPDDDVVLAGSGPLLLLLAWQYLHAGVHIKALLDVTPAGNYFKALPYLPRALLTGHYLAKGVRYQWDLFRAGIPLLYGVRKLRAYGRETLRSIGFVHKGREQSLDTGLLLVHYGVIPRIDLAAVAGCHLDWDRSQLCWRPRLDTWGRSSVDGILIAGDCGVIGGARMAEHEGRLAAIQALHALGRLDTRERDRLAAADRRWVQREFHVRPFLDAFGRVSDELLQVPDDDTVVCRCEEVTAGQIRAAIREGHADSNQVKFLTRCGMGPCQGRQCAPAVSQIVAAATATPVAQAGNYRQRPPVGPLTLGQLGSLFPEEEE